MKLSEQVKRHLSTCDLIYMHNSGGKIKLSTEKISIHASDNHAYLSIDEFTVRVTLSEFAQALEVYYERFVKPKSEKRAERLQEWGY